MERKEITPSIGMQPLQGRREVLGLFGGGAMAAAGLGFAGHAKAQAEASRRLGPGAVASHMSADQTAFFSGEAPVFRAFAQQFSLDPKVVYLMAGQKGSQPISVRKRYQEGLDQTARDPFPVYLEPQATTRARIARSYGASVDEIAISRNTTDALSQILMGIEWQRGDEILVAPMEHPAGLAPVLRLSARFGVKIVQWGVPVHRAAGAITVVDGAHYGGMIEPRLDESGIDFWAISGHKWQCGPGGTGILYVRNRQHPANSTPLPRFHLIRSAATLIPLDGSRPADFDIGAALSSYGFPESADPALRSAIVCPNPFPDAQQRTNPTINAQFVDRRRRLARGWFPIATPRRSHRRRLAMRCAPMPVCGTRLRKWSSSCGQPRTSCAR